MAEIDHVVVLMLENRSFDCMLGRLRPPGPDFDGLTGNETNVVNGVPIKVWTTGGGIDPVHAVPTPDPAELFTDMTAQIFGAVPGPPAPATMAGFAQNYAGVEGASARDIMHGFTPEQVPVLSALADAFAVSDRWFASAPNQTWPNRFFAHTGTAAGYVNNMPLHVPYMMETIFNRLTAAQRSWRIYFHDLPQSATLARIWSELPDHLYMFEEHFMADAMAGRLPNYSFIEPRYFACPLLNRMPNDQHPPHDVRMGERLIQRVYDAVRNGAGWDRTLLIITYDEHGGIYDHVPPPAAVPPDDLHPDGFTFDRYGVRVPAVLVSPWIPAGTVLRPPEGSPPFDHTSILATLRELFGLGEPLTRRDAAAPSLLPVLSLPGPDNPGPKSIAVSGTAPSLLDLAAAHDGPPNGMQTALAEFAKTLPAGSAAAARQIAEFTIRQEVAAVESAAESVITTVGDALTKAETGLTRFLRGPGAIW